MDKDNLNSLNNETLYWSIGSGTISASSSTSTIAVGVQRLMARAETISTTLDGFIHYLAHCITATTMTSGGSALPLDSQRIEQAVFCLNRFGRKRIVLSSSHL